jgi:hypothetical protein
VRAASWVTRLGRRLQSFMLRTEQNRALRPLWSAGYELLLRSVAVFLLRGVSGGVYVGGTFGHGEPVYGISDVDLIVVAKGAADRADGRRAKIKQRWRRLCRRLPFLPLVISEVYVYHEAELAEATSATLLTYGLGRTPGHDSASELVDEGTLLLRPGLWATEEWRLLSGRDVRPGKRNRDRQHERLAAWLELQFWWRLAFGACADPHAPHVPYLCVKLVAEPSRIWLWLTRGEQILARRAVLRRALELLPEEEEAFRAALALHDALPRSPAAPLADVIPFCLRLSARLARLLAAELADAGTSPVRLVQSTAKHPPQTAGTEPQPLPLADWRALVMPRGIEEAFAVRGWDPADPVLLGEAARAASPTLYPALRADGLLLFPAILTPETVLRSVQFGGSDPVSFALAAGNHVARFPCVAGWSACDVALRAVAEHRAWLESERGADGRRPAETIVALFTAARAALFLESQEAHEPELPLTLAATAERLGTRGAAAAEIAQSALVGYHAARSGVGQPSQAVVAALANLVRGLPAYSSRSRMTT